MLAAWLAPGALAAPPPVTWCGNDRVAGDRLPDAVARPQIHVVYAFPTDAPDRFDSAASKIATDVAAIDAWWRREDPSRTPRFDLFDFPGCTTAAGRLDISWVRLPRASAPTTRWTGTRAVAWRSTPRPGSTRTRRRSCSTTAPCRRA